MIRPVLVNSIFALLLLASTQASTQASAEGPRLDSREYKLMLEPAEFAGDQAAKIVDRFWDEALKPIIARRLDARDNGEPRSRKRFKLDKERVILFRDTEACLLDRNSYALRERVVLKNGEEDKSTREVTLKFRTPDIFLAAATELKGSSDEASTKLEEDISPVIVRARNPANNEMITLAQPRSMRSQFSISTKQRVGRDARFDVLGDAMNAYPTLQDNLRKAGNSGLAMNSRLIRGIPIHELVFEGAEVDLGSGTDGEFALTLWYRRDAASSSKPLIAEISFKYDTDEGSVNAAVARRAQRLFEAMQDDLRGWSNPALGTKTSEALPAACQ